MFAPLTAKPQAKQAAGPASKLISSSAPRTERRFRGSPAAGALDDERRRAPHAFDFSRLAIFPPRPRAAAIAGYTSEVDAQAADEPGFVGQTAAPSGPTAPPATAPGPTATGPAPAQAGAAAPQSGFVSVVAQTRAAAPDGTSNLRQSVGPGETVDFFPQTSPSVLDLTGGVPANWTATAGTPLTAAGAGIFTWSAPEPAGNVTITATMPSSGQSTATTMSVVPPNDIAGHKTAEDSIPKGTEGAGMVMRYVYLPLNVNFDNVQEMEDPGPPSNISGYFQDLAQAGMDLNHHPNRNWVTLQNNAVRDHAFLHGPMPVANPPPFEQGHFEWQIPNRYRALIPGFGVGGPGVVFTTTLQTFDMLGADGTMMITKQGAIVVRAPGGFAGAGDFPTPGNPLDLPQPPADATPPTTEQTA